MSSIKIITITKQHFNNLEKVYHDHLTNHPDDLDSLKTFQNILDQCIDQMDDQAYEEMAHRNYYSNNL